jgi:hypothetical protein
MKEREKLINSCEVETINVVQRIEEKTNSYYFHITPEMERLLLEEIDFEIKRVKNKSKEKCLRCSIDYVKPGETILARASFNLPDHTCKSYPQ